MLRTFGIAALILNIIAIVVISIISTPLDPLANGITKLYSY